MNINARSQVVAATTRRGFTLLELLVAMTLTLLLTALVVQVFSFVSDGVYNSRATMDLSDQLRNAKHRIIQDLRGVTAPMTPPLDPSSESGYLEYIEGPRVANYPGGDIGRPVASLSNAMQTYYGDLDDILMFTTVCYDEELIAKGPSDGIKSRYAEIAYFIRPISRITITGSQAAGSFDTAEYFTLHRRVWLVNPNANWGDNFGVADVSMRQERGIYENLAANTAVVGLPATSTSATLPPTAVNNSLGDLTMRERRPIHQPNDWPYDIFYTPNNGPIRSIAGTVWPKGNPYLTLPSLTEQSDAKFANPIADAGSKIHDPMNQRWRITNTNTESKYQSLYQFDPGGGNREQADILLTNVVGFDIKAWDPGAPVFRASPGSTEGSNPNIVGLLVPGDAGYGGDGSRFTSTSAQNPVGALQRFINSPGDAECRPVSFGAYADLNYMWINLMGGEYNMQRRLAYHQALKQYEQGTLGSGAGTLPRPAFGFASPRSALSGYSPVGYQYPAVYDTWSRHYEYDGIDQDGDNIADQGTNGLDDNDNGLIDEPDLDLYTGDDTGLILPDGIAETIGETEVPPPYPAPLRGIKITIRVMEKDSRQVREVTIVHEFLPL